MFLKQSTVRNRSFLLVQSSDHLTGLIGATPTVTLSKDCAAFAAAAGVITEIGSGWYKIALTIVDTNTKGDLAFHCTAAGADSNDFADQVVTDLPGDSVASVGAAVTVTGTPSVNITQIDGNATNANAATLNLKQLNIVNSGGDALVASSTGAGGSGINASGNGAGTGLKATGGATGPGAKVVGGATSGDGLDISTTAGDGLSILPTAGSAIVATGNGTSKHGIVSTGGTAGTSDGVKAVAGVGGVDLRANITGNITGNLSGSAGSVTGAVGSVTARVTANTDQIVGVAPTLDGNGLLKVDVEDWKAAVAPANTGDAFARLGAPVGASISADVAGVPTATLAATVETNGSTITRTVRDTLKVLLAGLGGTRSGFGTAAPAIGDTAGLGKVRILGSAADGVGNATVTIDTTGG